eukprot:TRINITY_DN47046_c0_g1_i1.p2 TRINITY_DN47046_c0_g1~~TRINITY_DN47046_c0_g1_i1.p2  ORF type:complete len:336 (+),score=92.88 TRINITY_DN47046_c0_g1_i1:79-1008(+)
MPSELAVTMAASAIAGGLGRLPCHPLDTVKARLQAAQCAGGAAPAKLNRIHTVFLDTIRGEGLRGLYRGIGISAVGATPAMCLYLSSYEGFKHLMAPIGLQSRFLTDFVAGFGAEAVSCCLWVPIDVVKERLQVQTPDVKGRYRNSLDGLRTVSQQEGFRGLYRGYFSTLGSFGPYSAFYFLFYEQFKTIALERSGRDSSGITRQVSFQDGMMCAAAASGLAAAVTNPLDMVKLRLQVQRTRTAAGTESTQFSYKYRGMLHGLGEIIRTEGPLALWKGCLARVLFAGPNAAITMALFEQLRSSLSTASA